LILLGCIPWMSIDPAYSYLLTPFTFIILPFFIWQKFQETYYPGNSEALMLYSHSIFYHTCPLVDFPRCCFGERHLSRQVVFAEEE